MSYEVIAVEYFRRRLKKLRKKYRRIGEDYESLIETLENNPSEGDAIPALV
jgi:mRNA-degrading endonuclease RelE of RelBE toxin-antitoxin system